MAERLLRGIVTLEMLCCLWVESTSAKCYMPQVGTGAGRRTCLTQARMFGEFWMSSNHGERDSPETRVSSSFHVAVLEDSRQVEGLDCVV